MRASPSSPPSTIAWWPRTPCLRQSAASRCTLLAAVGGLSMPRLGLNVVIYDTQVHYQQVRDAWVGVRNPDGR